MTDKSIDIRGTLLAAINSQDAASATNGSLQSGSLLGDVARKLGLNRNDEYERALLTEFQDLFRSGYLAWGLNLSNPNAPFFHVTNRGRTLLARITRDPGNPVAYKAHLYGVATINEIARSYIEEAAACYAADLAKSAAVMVGAAAESLVLELRDAVVAKLGTVGIKPPKGLEDWQIKRVLDALHGMFAMRKADMPNGLWEEFDAYWSAYAQQIRAARNEAGHPSSVDPVTPDTVHAALLLFPELAKLQNRLMAWVTTSLG